MIACCSPHPVLPEEGGRFSVTPILWFGIIMENEFSDAVLDGLAFYGHTARWVGNEDTCN